MVLALKLKYEKESVDVIDCTGEDKSVESRKSDSNSEEGPLSDGDSHCDKCIFKSKNRVLLMEHKEQKHTKLSCLMCGKISPNTNTFKIHQKIHEAELKVGSITAYPLDMYEFKCFSCNKSYKCWNYNMEHLTKVHLTNSQPQGPVKNNEDTSKEHKDSEKKPNSNIKCKNGTISQCKWARYGRCNFNHIEIFFQKCGKY